MRRNSKKSLASRGQRRNRRLFLEPLETRQMLAAVPVYDEGTVWETFAGNYVPPQEYHSASPSFLTGPQAGNRMDIGINYFKNHAASFGVAPSDLDHLTVTNDYADDHSGVRHIYLQQTFQGLPIADAVGSIHISASGQVISAGLNFIPGLLHPPDNFPWMVTADIPASTALQSLASQTGGGLNLQSTMSQTIGGPAQATVFSGAGIAGLSADPIPASLHYVPKPGGGIELAWKFVIRNPAGTHWYEGSVGAYHNGRPNQVIRLGDYISDAAYNAYVQPVDGPLDGIQTVAINPHSPVASPFGWHDINGFPGPEFFDVRGNNASAQEDLNGDLAGGTRPTSPILEFNVPFILPSPPGTYTDASTINSFYWTNLTHDITYHHGFNERAGNFQQENYSHLGLADDAVNVYTQSPLAANNAFMGTPPDGQPPFMALGIVNAFVPTRDLGLDSVVIVHEYTHGISNRLTGGPANANALLSLQSGGMGEGWGDWLGLLLTINPGETRNTPRTIAEWAFGPGGIRRAPYSFDLAINPRTLNDFNGGFPNNEVHAAGEIWASALWDMTWLLIERYGFDSNWYSGDGGNNLAMQLVLDGMKLQPANPSFLEARDAIVAADLALTGGANYTEIWTAFARRGFGRSANVGASAASSVVVEAFDMPPPLSGVRGTVYDDSNNSGTINSSDARLAGWTIYVDSNNNGALDVGEPSTVSAANGTYSLPLNRLGPNVIREIVQPEWTRVLPASGSYTVTATQGSSFSGRNFLNRQQPGQVTGVKFNDLDGNGTRDPGEPGLAGVMIYVDVNDDGHVGVLEPVARTDASGNYRIANVPVGTFNIREVAQPGLVQTFPDPLDVTTNGGAHIGVVITRGGVTSDINFGNQQQLDFGDAPASYGTLLANNGPRHGIVLGYGLTLTPGSSVGVVDAEQNGQPNPPGRGDDLTGISDETGVVVGALTPGSPSSVRVGVRTSGFSSGVLQGWIDFNRDGDFLDAGEQIIKDRALGTGIHDIQFQVPANAQLGSTFSRFRYGIERGIGPTGAAVVGEVEDHPTNVLQDAAVAINDVFPDLTRVPPDPFIQLNSVDNPLDVLRNDFGTTIDPLPEIVNDFNGPNQTRPTAAGGTIRFVGANSPLLYTPPPGVAGADSFSYSITAGGSPNPSTASVSLTISPSNPIAIDDFFSFGPGPNGQAIDVLANDKTSQGQTKLIKAGSLIPLTLPQQTTLTLNANRDRAIFTAPPGFRGTVRYQYTLEDSSPTTSDSTATITIQVGDSPNTPAPSHAALFRTQYLAATAAGDAIPGAVSSIDLQDSEFFWVQLIVHDPAGTPLGMPETEGVESAYVDLLINEVLNSSSFPLVEPVVVGGNFVITFNDRFPLLRADNPDFSLPGVVNEIGAAHDTRLETDPGDVPPEGSGNSEVLVMTVQFRALRAGKVRIQADHADSPNFPISLFVPAGPSDPLPRTIPITDEQVFIQPAGELDISNGSGEGEFTNALSQYDVNADENVNVLDLMMVVNDLTSNGSRPLNQFAIAMSGVLPAGYLDTNLDAFVNVLDLTAIVNYLTARGPVAPATGGGSGEGEGEGSAAAASEPMAMRSLASPAGQASDDLGTLVLAHTVQQADETTDSIASDKVDPSPEEIALLSASSASEDVLEALTTEVEDEEPSAIQRLDGKQSSVDSAAADELFGRLTSFREQLRRR